MSQVVENTNNQSLNHFLTDSVWRWQPVMDAISNRCFRFFATLGNPIGLLMDESGLPKSGKHSVGIAHQYCGQTGKPDNCQVGVFGALCSGHLVSIIQSKLYLPKAWISDKKRCQKAKVPKHEVGYKSKIELAEEIIFYVWGELRLKFDFVSFDAFYGRDLSFLQRLDKARITFMASVPENHSIYLRRFTIKVPDKKTGRGRKPIHAKPSGTKISIKDFINTLPATAFKRLTIRKGTRGDITASYHKSTVWLFNEENKTMSRFILLVRRDDDGTLYYNLTNSRKHLRKLAFMQGQRYFVERSFQDAKQQLGLNQYQVRSYAGWYRHITMTMLGMHFITEERSRQGAERMYTTAHDIVEILIYLLPRKLITLEELEKKVKEKNKRHEALVKSAKPG